uniref:Uncharacterized protein n=1 Tax=Oryza barthii TaxID=65489 RepID=A0A0D3HKN1_9ORYZ
MKFLGDPPLHGPIGLFIALLQAHTLYGSICSGEFIRIGTLKGAYSVHSNYGTFDWPLARPVRGERPSWAVLLAGLTSEAHLPWGEPIVLHPEAFTQSGDLAMSPPGLVPVRGERPSWAVLLAGSLAKPVFHGANPLCFTLRLHPERRLGGEPSQLGGEPFLLLRLEGKLGGEPFELGDEPS